MPKLDDRAFDSLREYLDLVPAVSYISHGSDDDGIWWLKLAIDLDHHLAWNVVQEFGCVLNYVSIDERLPTVFMPVSPAPYLNGGPRDFLSWVIEAKSADFRPGTCREWLEGRLPRPVEDESNWLEDE